MGQSKPYGYGKNETEFNYSVNASMGGSNFGFPTGSTFKPFVAAAALEEGRPPNQSYSSPYQMAYPDPVQTCSGKPWTNDGRPKYTLENESKSEKSARTSCRRRWRKSVNTYFVQLLSRHRHLPRGEDDRQAGRGPGQTAPSSPRSLLDDPRPHGLSPLTMASAYATFANRGMYCTPVAIESITDTVGGTKKSLEVPKSTCSRAMCEKTADTINTLLSGVVDYGTGTAGRPVRPRQRRQDRYDRLPQERLVRRLHPEPGGRGLGRQRHAEASR